MESFYWHSRQDSLFAMSEERDPNTEQETILTDHQKVHLEETRTQLAEMEAPLAVAEVGKPEAAVPLPPPLLTLSEEDDIESYMLIFERTATLNLWPKTEWAYILAPYLKGDAQRAYCNLSEEEAADYDTLKDEIFKYYGITVDQQAREWRQWKFDPDKPIKTQAFEFWRKTRCWLRPDVNNARQVVEQFACEALVNALPDHLAQQVRRHPYRNMDALIEVIERHWLVSKMERSERTARLARQGCVIQPEPSHCSTEPLVKPKEKLPSLPRCYKCGELGHIITSCPLGAKLMDCSWACGERKTED
ncbi:uncharacterized protein LOC114647585 [Erpetoichthys calabaricus]|uniref:Uncharacterized LOC114647585 n=1 Tax=Erpetoichthys calabaricus TaxID=27687 RepID=A0A8C4SQM9_ERPCA|nr:uncharacterized protein LOC114647585 [Erpetoichthys calabaricus]